jgi:hypothetical protein
VKLATVVIAILLASCGEGEAPEQNAAEPEQPSHLHVPPITIARARRQALGLSQLPPDGRRTALEQGRARGSPSYTELRANADRLADTRASYAGRVSLVRPAGRRLWIVALMTGENRRSDPLYALSVVDPSSLEGRDARVDGWIVGERTVGRYTLPLLVAFYFEPL